MNETLFELLKFTLPALILSGVMLYIYNEYAQLLKDQNELSLQGQTSKETINTRLQAFERMTLFLERINPTALISIVREPQMTVRDFHLALLQQIRAEYEHNTATQVYISNDTWNAILSTKENIITIINKASQNVDPNADSKELAKKIIEIMDLLNVSNPSDAALMMLRNEAKMYI